jgi:hypothetical protein
MDSAGAGSSRTAMRQFAASSCAPRLSIVSVHRDGGACALLPARRLIPTVSILNGKNMKLNVLLFAALGAMAAQSSWAADISVTDAWARATMPGQKVSGA